ncbi:MAG: DNA-processing protein DprA [Clostridia bacterium]|nr:DNA-processing protein DprA [Clostridia bacterium]
MTETQRLWLWLNYATEQNPKLFYRILQQFDDIEEIYEAALRRRFSVFDELPDSVRDRMVTAGSDQFMDRYISWLDKNRIGVTTPESDDYPALLSQIADPPSVLFYRGTMHADSPLPIAVIGSRNMTDYGKEVAQLFGQQIAEHNGTVVSGLAQGIDSEAARGALSCVVSECPVIGVLPCGIDVAFGSPKAEFYEEVAERGCVMTELLPKTPVMKFVFQMRNRILSGLSRGVLVVEAGERSGTAFTVDHAHEQGREVFAVPGRITDLMSAGTNRLIVRGEAKPVVTIQDVLSEFSEFTDLQDGELNPNARRIRFSTLSKVGQEIYMALLQGEKSADELFEWVDTSPADMNAALTELQFCEVIKQLPGRVYAIDSLKSVVTFDAAE